MDDILAVGDYQSEQRDVLSVLWAITKACTFGCSYCVYHKSPRHAEYSSRADLLRAARTLLRLARPGYQVTLYGGEPTLHPHFGDLVQYFVASRAPVELRMYTNGGRSEPFFQSLARTTRGHDVRVIFSLHLEYANFAKFLRAVEVTLDGGMSVGVSFMFAPTWRDKARAAMAALFALRQRMPFFISINYPYTAEGLLGAGCTAEDVAWIDAARGAFDALPMPGHLRTPFYTRIESDIEVMQAGVRRALPRAESLRLLAAMHTPDFGGYYCCSGTNVMFVEEDGAVRGGVCDASGYLGNLFTDSEIQLIQNMAVVRCAAPACNSIENIPLPKFRDRAEAEAQVAGFRGRAKGALFRAEARRLTATGEAAQPAATAPCWSSVG